MAPNKKVYLVVPTYGTGKCTAYFNRINADREAKKLGDGMATVEEFIYGGADLTLNAAAKEAYEVARSKGFWDGLAADVTRKLLLIHTEVSEATEEVRRGREDTYYTEKPDGPPKPEGLLPELADVLIRTLDLMHELGANVEAVVREKMDYNKTRPRMNGDGKTF